MFYHSSINWKADFWWDIGTIWKGATHNASWAPQYDSVLWGSGLLWYTRRFGASCFGLTLKLIFLPFYFWKKKKNLQWPKSETELKQVFIYISIQFTKNRERIYWCLNIKQQGLSFASLFFSFYDAAVSGVCESWWEGGSVGGQSLGFIGE